MAMHKSGRNDTKNPGAAVKNDIGKRGGKDLYLRDYITRKQESDNFFTSETNDDHRFPKKKLTFDEWAEDSQIIYRSVETKADLVHYLQLCWKAAQENV